MASVPVPPDDRINFEAPAPAASTVNVWASAVTDIAEVFNASTFRPPALAFIQIASVPVPSDLSKRDASTEPNCSIVKS